MKASLGRKTDSSIEQELTSQLAHHCTKDHVANKIMQVFYHKQHQQGVYNLPKILGLTASPILSDLSAVQYVLAVF
jgi:hypothetical protein